MRHCSTNKTTLRWSRISAVLAFVVFDENSLQCNVFFFVEQCHIARGTPFEELQMPSLLVTDWTGLDFTIKATGHVELLLMPLGRAWQR